MNNKGYIAPATLLVILIISLMMFGIFYTRTVSVTGDMVQSSKLSDEMNDNNIGYERAHALLYENVSFEGLVNYNDISKKYNISTVNEQYETILLNSENGSPINFEIKNRTPIEVKLTVFPLNPEINHSYSAELITNGKNLLENAEDLHYDFNEIVDADKTYNKQTQENNYGDYSLNITKMKNCIIKVSVNYDILRERELILKNDLIEKEIVIKNNEKLTIEFKKGGK